MSEKQDRRTRKTRQQLRSALLSLLKEKRYEEISVQEIIERADVARSTFYAHYVDKDDLLTGGQGIFAENLGHQITAHPEEKDTSAFSARLWFRHVQAQEPVLRIIAKDPAMDLAMQTLRGIIHRSVQEGMQNHAVQEAAGIPRLLVVDYLADTLMTLIRWWFRDGMRRTPEQMDDLFRQLALPGVLPILINGKGARHETH